MLKFLKTYFHQEAYVLEIYIYNILVSMLLVHLNEYHLASAAYTLHGENAKVWIEEIKRAQVGLHRPIQVKKIQNASFSSLSIPLLSIA